MWVADVTCVHFDSPKTPPGRLALTSVQFVDAACTTNGFGETSEASRDRDSQILDVECMIGCDAFRTAILARDSLGYTAASSR